MGGGGVHRYYFPLFDAQVFYSSPIWAMMISVERTLKTQMVRALIVFARQ